MMKKTNKEPTIRWAVFWIVFGIIMTLTVTSVWNTSYHKGFVDGFILGDQISLENCQIETTYTYEDGTQGVSIEECNRSYDAFNPEKTEFFKAEQKVIYGRSNNE